MPARDFGVLTDDSAIVPAKRCATRALRLMVWLGVAHAVTWALLMARPMPTAAQRLETRVDRTEEAVVDMKMSIATLNERLNNFASLQLSQSGKIDALDAKLSRFLEGLVGLFVAIAGALLTILWGMRSKWLNKEVV